MRDLKDICDVSVIGEIVRDVPGVSGDQLESPHVLHLPTLLYLLQLVQEGPEYGH